MTQQPNTFDFDSIAHSYDAWYETASGRMCDILEKKAAARMLPHSTNGERLLDVGCGTGHWACLFSDLGFRVIGIDCSPSMVHMATAKEIPNASFEVGDAHGMRFGNGDFDVSVAITTLEFVRNPEAVVQEMIRCTRRTGGIVLVGVLNALARLNRIRKAADKPPYNAARPFSPSELKQMLAPYGDVRVACSTFVPSCPSLLPFAPAMDAIGRLLRLRCGAFVVARAIL